MSLESSAKPPDTPPRKSRLSWHADESCTAHGTYVLQCERIRGEPPYYTLWYRPASGNHWTDLGPAREKNATGWKRAGTRYEVKALAQEHHDAQAASI